MAPAAKYATAIDFSPTPKINWYLDSEAYKAILERACDDFAVEMMHLGRLLGTRTSGQIYQWTGGHKAPSSKYMARLVVLYQMHNTDTPLAAIRGIDWASGEGEISPTKPRKGKGEHDRPIPLTRRRVVSDQEGSP